MAICGDVLANTLAAAGFSVDREYYINDTGTHILTLGRSTYLRYRQIIEGVDEPLEEGLYQGSYIKEHAKALLAERGTFHVFHLVQQLPCGRRELVYLAELRSVVDQTEPPTSLRAEFVSLQ